MKCKYSEYCGGCSMLDIDIGSQLKLKTKSVKELFEPLTSNVTDCFGDYYPLKYRNKIHLCFSELKGKTLIGFYEENSIKVTDLDSCLLFGDWALKLIAILREYVSRFKIRPYNRISGTGILRYAHARCINNRIQLTLVAVTENFGGRDWLYDKLKETFTEVSLYLNINKRTDHAVLSDNAKFVKGSKYLKFNFAGVETSIVPNSFLQVNLSIAEKMYKEAINMLSIDEKTTVVDLYSGIGVTSIMFSKLAGNVIAIEEVSSATENAKYMAKLNNAKNIKVLTGKCENMMAQVHASDNMVVFTDPARAGMEKSVIDALLNLSPRKIVYMSCNPETCFRDIKQLVSDNRYKINIVKPYNMFPYTEHLELLCELERV